MVKQIANDGILKEISKEMVELEAKIAKWDPTTNSFQLMEKWIDREKELICFRFEVVEAICRGI